MKPMTIWAEVVPVGDPGAVGLAGSRITVKVHAFKPGAGATGVGFVLGFWALALLFGLAGALARAGAGGGACAVVRWTETLGLL